MPIDIDGFAVLGAIAARRETFASLGVEASEAARGLVVKRLKDKSLTLPQLVEVAAALGCETFDLILDNLSDAEVKALLGKIDKHGPEAKGDSAPAKRRHVSRLAKVEVSPSGPAAKAAPAEKPPKPVNPTLTRAGADGKFTRAKSKVRAAAG